MVSKNICLIFGIVLLLGVVSAWSVDITSPVNGSYWNENSLCNGFNYCFNWNLAGILDSEIKNYNSYIINNYPHNNQIPWNSKTILFLNSGEINNEGYNNLTLIFTNKTNSSDIQTNTSIFWLDEVSPYLNLIEPLSNYTNNNSIYMKANVSESFLKKYELNGSYYDFGIEGSGPLEGSSIDFKALSGMT